ncbi:hypothetical protein [Halopseudomonas salegens]|uniref:Uncharacterized protein n=1 Tax=Halopseudomonas salegens TaxID=1434072 RepID=A0A1H2G815_9GAMM|nr:hypothetical protein [Halopseudomonas salegens]SDU15735.1 hypothetical protein SAMN05216210_2108 [Halopseudomonas salegens]
MEIIPDDILATKVVSDGDDYTLTQSQVFLRGVGTETILAGAILELCVGFHDSYVVFMSDDIPSEDMLRIYLLNNNAHVIESVTIGAPYSTGSFRFSELIEPDMVAFNFTGSTMWKLRAFNKSKLHVPFFSDPKGVSRKIRFSTCLEVDGDPAPES